MLPRVTFLLPHDKSYYGFRHVATKKDGLFLDVGANNGMTAAGFRRLNQEYRILSIEADRHHEPALKGLKRRTQRFDYMITGVGSAVGDLMLYTPMYKGIPIHAQTSSHREYMEEVLRRVFTPKVIRQIVYDEQLVNVIPIDSLNLQPDIVKIDVEGHDYQVLLGMKQTIDRCRPVVMVEFDPEKAGVMSDFFVERSYRLFVYDENKDVFLPFDEKREAAAYKECSLQVNISAIPAERPGIAGMQPGDLKQSKMFSDARAFRPRRTN